MDGMAMDVRLAVRSLRATPGFSLAATLVLALGLGANAAVFSALRVAVLAPAPFPDAERMAYAELTRAEVGGGPASPMIWSYPKYRAFLEMADRPIDPAVGYAGRSVTLTGLGPAERIRIELVTPGYFELLGGSPVLGRAFDRSALDPGVAPLEAVLAWRAWMWRFDGDTEILGRTVTFEGHDLVVVGVAPRGFEGLTGGVEAWVPMAGAGTIFSPFMVEGQGAHWFHVIGRLAPGTTLEQARERMAVAGDAISARFPPPNSARIYSGSARSLGEVRTNERARDSILFLTVAAVLVLLVACANLSGLLLARARRKARDGAVRMAVGASRWRLIRASLVESGVLALLGGVAGVALALGGTKAMAAAWPSGFSAGAGGDLRLVDPSALGVDPPVLLFAVGVTFATTLLFGAGPAWRASRADLRERLRDGSGATERGRRLFGLDARGLLVGGQVALALMLVIGVGLVGNSTWKLLSVDEGFDADNLLTFAYTLPLSSSRSDDPVTFHEELMARLEVGPNIRAATFGCPPLRGHCIVTHVDAIEGGPPIEAGTGPEIGARMVDDRHFEALGIPLLAGRTFGPEDGRDREPTVILNERAIEALFPDGDALGRGVTLGLGSSERDDVARVVGIVGDVLYRSPDQGVIPEAYYSLREYPENHGNITVRTTGEPLAAVPTIRAAMAETDPMIAAYRFAAMDALVLQSIGDRRTTLGLLVIFALVTVLLAATGTWGVVAYAVASRRRELGLRLALGAGRTRVLREVLGHGARAALLGVGGGLAGGRMLTGLLESLLWQTEPGDPAVFAAGAALLVTVVMVASWLPARRAARVDPAEALRNE